MILTDVEVICHEGHRTRERPRRVLLDGAWLEVVDILDRWYQGGVAAGSPNLNYFKVRLADGRDILLRYVPLFDRWAMVGKEG